MKVLVSYDGSSQAKDALRYGVEKVKLNGGEVVALHVFNNNLFLDYDVFGAEETGRAESMRLTAEAKKILEETGKGISSRVIFAEGNPEEETISYARDNKSDILICPPRHKSIIRSFKKLLDKQGRKAQQDTIIDETERPTLAVVSQR
jgi:nucleotide-binding universal stress UspA family protein